MDNLLSQNDENTYINNWIKQKLEEKNDEQVIISHETGKADIVTIREKADRILRNYYVQPKVVYIVEAAVDILQSCTNAIKSGFNINHPLFQQSTPY